MLSGLPEALAARQPTFASTGGLHAAALFGADGTIRDVREDVGRHNAVDKLIGAALRAGELPFWNLGILVSGRASFEIVEKARMAGCPLLVAVGAPSSLAIDAAWESGITLVGFLRDGRFNVYTVSGADSELRRGSSLKILLPTTSSYRESRRTSRSRIRRTCSASICSSVYCLAVSGYASGFR